MDKREGMAAVTSDRQSRLWLPGLALVIIVTAVVHLPVLSGQAVCFDDQQYLLDNALVRNPSWQSASRFLAEVAHPSTVRGYYQPLSMISLMLDCAMGGRAGDLFVFHRTSLALHLLNVTLVAILLRKLTGSVLGALVAALLFAIHPLTVEPLAWVADRKTLLATFFSLASIAAYVESATTRRVTWYLVSLMAFGLGLASKPTVLPLPVMLMLLDFWPLRRFGRRIIIEKAPYFLLAGGFGIITIVSQARANEWLDTALDVGVMHSVIQAIFLVYFYLARIFVPRDLCPVYVMPAPMSLSNAAVLIGVLVVLGMAAVLMMSLRRTKAPAVCMAIFLAAISPTLGGIRYSWAVAQDKYLYFPAIGILLFIAWALVGLKQTSFPFCKPVRVLVALIIVIAVACEATHTRRQYGIWTNTLGLGRYMAAQAPQSFQVHKLLGTALIDSGRFDEGIEQFEIGERIMPSDGEFAFNLGLAADRQGRVEDAVRHFTRAMPLRKSNSDVACSLGVALQSLGRFDEAIAAFEEAIRRRDDNVVARVALAISLASAGRGAEAVSQLERAIRERPDWPTAMKMLAWILATHPSAEVRNGSRAMELAGRAAKLSGDKDASVLDTLAAALAEAGRFDEAALMADKAAGLYREAGRMEESRQALSRAAMFRRRDPLRDLTLQAAK
jgi:tetratricopeptide (TPR) repeat protein